MDFGADIKPHSDAQTGEERAPACAARHQIVVCTRCRHTGSECRPGADLIKRLRAAIDMAEKAGAGDDLEVSGMACLAGCSRPCTVAFRADGKATYLFGDIEEGADIDALVEFARQYQRHEDGWTNSTQRPAALSGKTLARIPAAITIARHTDEALQ